jgi:Flp pilus assembly pilin Flp
MDAIVLPTFVLGLVSSLVTEALKFLPFIAKTERGKKLLAFIISVLVVAGYAYSNKMFVSSELTELLAVLIAVVISAYGIFRAVIQPVEQKIAGA